MHTSEDYTSLLSPSFGGSDEQLTQHPALVVLVISDGVVQFMTYGNLQDREPKMNHNPGRLLKSV